MLVAAGEERQSRPALAAVRALHDGRYAVAVTSSGSRSLAASSRFCGRIVAVPPVSDPAFRAEVELELTRGGYVTSLPASDSAMLALGEPVAHLIDKAELAGRAAAAGLETPPGEVFDTAGDLLAAASRLPYPVIVKPTRAKPARRANGASDLRWWEGRPGPFIVQPFITEEMSSVAGVLRGGELIASVHQRYLRTWPTEGGGACAAETTPPDLGREERVVELLRGFDGIFHAQFAGRFLLDVNPRVYGSLPLAVAAGANLAAIHCDLIRGIRPPAIPVRGTPGAFYRWLDGDVRRAWAAVRRREVSVSTAARWLLPRRGTAHATESLRDPRPMVVRLARRPGGA